MFNERSLKEIRESIPGERFDVDFDNPLGFNGVA